MPFNADPFISKTPGFPKPGITFYDISPILEDAAALRQTMEALSDLTRPMAPEIIAGVDGLRDGDGPQGGQASGRAVRAVLRT